MPKENELVSGATRDRDISATPYKKEDNCYTRLMTEGHLTCGDHGISPKDISFDWVDPDSVKKGQQYFR
jgi:hypothetical protein